MITWRFPVLFCLAFVAVEVRGQNEFDLSDAFDNPAETTPKPVPSKKPAGDPFKTPTPAPAPKPKPGGDDGFDLGDAVGHGDDMHKKPTIKPQPGHGGAGGHEFGDDDLFDAAGGKQSPNHPGEDQGQHPKEEADVSMGFPGTVDTLSQNISAWIFAPAAQPGVVAGVVSAVGVALVGAVSSFIAYQKKKLCFKGGDDPENVNMESHKGEQREPQVQSSLLQ
ncbi:CD99 antigen-like isoform X2 [Ascaphus truei]|uniref:CD99 antigen-like isoform X2 n=1 Tax=Ascaphus truei TaxID=8439 RepID=UPI003F592144